MIYSLSLLVSYSLFLLPSFLHHLHLLSLLFIFLLSFSFFLLISPFFPLYSPFFFSPLSLSPPSLSLSLSHIFLSLPLFSLSPIPLLPLLLPYLSLFFSSDRRPHSHSSMRMKQTTPPPQILQQSCRSTRMTHQCLNIR